MAMPGAHARHKVVLVHKVLVASGSRESYMFGNSMSCSQLVGALKSVLPCNLNLRLCHQVGAGSSLSPGLNGLHVLNSLPHFSSLAHKVVSSEAGVQNSAHGFNSISPILCKERRK